MFYKLWAYLRGVRKIRQSTPLSESVRIYAPSHYQLKKQLLILEGAGFRVVEKRYDLEHSEWRAVVIKEVIAFPG